MIEQRFLVVACCALLFTSGCSEREESQASLGSSAGNPDIDAIFSAWDVPGSPGCALAVAEEGELVYSSGYGYANLDYDLPITPKTIFDVASVTKQFNAASIVMLQIDGDLSLDDDVREWLPELPQYEWPITLRQMLHHTSGLRDYLNLFPLAGRNDYYPISHAQIRDMMSRQSALIFPPGEQYRYSNSAYMLLAQVVARASGKSFGDFTADRIFQPLGMTGSFMYDDFEMIVPQRATGYVLDDDGTSRIVHNYNFDVAGDGQMYTTMEDLLLWDDYLHGPVKPPIHDEMLQEGKLNDGEPTGYGLGLRLREHRGLKTVGHSGSSWGFRTELVRYIEPALSIAISCNLDNINPQELARQVAEHYLGDMLEPEEVEETPGAEEFDEEATEAPTALTAGARSGFTGAFYSYELDAIYRLTTDGQRLLLRIEQNQPSLILPVSPDRFEAGLEPGGLPGSGTMALQFERSASGDVSGFLLSSRSERDIVFERMDRLDAEHTR